MSTPQDLVNRAGRLLVNSGVSINATLSANALISLNAMMDSWRNEKLMCWAFQDETLTLVANQTTYSVGPSGSDLTTTRPVEIEAAYVVVSNLSYPVRLINEEEYAAIVAKASVSTWPTHMWVAYTMPNITLTVYPVPNTVTTLNLITRVVLTQFSSLSDTVSLPPGWEDALASNLALYLAPEWQVAPSQMLTKMAIDSKANIKRQNARPVRAYTELRGLISQHRANILTDQP